MEEGRSGTVAWSAVGTHRSKLVKDGFHHQQARPAHPELSLHTLHTFSYSLFCQPPKALESPPTVQAGPLVSAFLSQPLCDTFGSLQHHSLRESMGRGVSHLPHLSFPDASVLACPATENLVEEIFF